MVALELWPGVSLQAAAHGSRAEEPQPELEAWLLRDCESQ